MAQKFQHVRGMPDILPDERDQVEYVTALFKQLADAAGYKRIDTPMLEEKGVFVRGVGEGTDIVDKEMYVFNDRSDNQLALRPEPTAGIARAYIEHGMASWPQPVKLQIAGPMFRYDRPQAGRRRQFHQLGVEVLGDASSSIDAQVISLADRLYRKLGLTKLTLRLNTLGSSEDRAKYLEALADYLKKHKDQLGETDQSRVEANPLRVLDSKDISTAQIVKDAPIILDYLSDESKKHFAQVQEYLDALSVKYEITPTLVRGLDYYTHTVFEFVGEREGAQSSLGGGGRYDGLVEQLGGQPTPAAGFGIGIERVLLELEAEQLLPEIPSPLQVYVASLGEPARVEAFLLIERLLDVGVGVVGSVDKGGIGAQLERANKLGAPFALIIGEKEVQAGEVLLRNMDTGTQETLRLKTVAKELSKRFTS